MTLESLREQHYASKAEPNRRALRLRARKLAAQLEQPVPEWASVSRSRRRKRVTSSSEAPPTQGPPPSEALQVSPALSAWRAGGPGRVVNVRRDGSVALLCFAETDARREAAFADSRTAERALLLGITWRQPVAKAG